MRDANGMAIGGTPKITLTENPGGEVASSANAVNGVATFSGVTLFVAGSGITLTASGPGLVSATSAPFNVAPGAPTHLGFLPQPRNAVMNALLPAFGVRIQDANSNVVTSSTAKVTIALGAGPAGATLSGTTAVNAVGGIAAFTNLMLDKVGSYTLKASASGLTGATSSTFSVATDKIFASGFQ
jgi:hypothetical protein